MPRRQRRRSTRRRVVVVLGAAALMAFGLLVACGDDGGDTAESSDTTAAPTTAPSTEVVVELDPSADDAQLEVAAGVLTERIELLGVRATIGRGGPTVTLVVDVADEPLVRAALEGAGRVEFRPVLEFPGPDATLTPPDGAASGEEVVLPDAEGTPHRLGPTRLTGAALEGVAVALTPQATWQLEPVLLPGAAGIDAFNAIAGSCFAGAPDCPPLPSDGRGSLAIVADGEVLTAPSINAPDFERNQISVSGGFTETEARALAAQMGAGERPIAWNVAD